MPVRRSFLAQRIAKRQKDGYSPAMAKHYARVEWDRNKAGRPLSVEIPPIPAPPALNNRFAEKAGEKLGPRRRRFLQFLRELPLPKAGA